MPRSTSNLRPLSTLAFLLAFGLGSARAADDDEANKSAAKAAKTEEKSENAQEAEEEARELFLAGKRLASKGNYEKACAKFEASLKLKVGMGTQFNLADCWEQMGRSASARELFLKVAEAAAEADQEEREQAARERAKALESKVPKLAIGVQSPVSGLVIERGEERLDNERWSLALPVDPGTYELKASAKGYKSWTKTVKVPASDETIAVEVPELVEIKAMPAPAKAGAKKKLVPAPKVEINPQTQNWFTTGRKVGLVLAGVGAAGLTVGVVASLQYKSKNDEARAICPTSIACTRAEIIDHDELVHGAKTARYWAFIGYGVGGAATVGSVVAFVAGAKPPPGARAEVRAEPWVSGDGSFGAALSGRF